MNDQRVLSSHFVKNSVHTTFIGREPAGPIHMQLTQSQPTSSSIASLTNSYFKTVRWSSFAPQEQIRTLVFFPALLHVNYSDDRVKLLTLPVQLQSARVLGIPTDQDVPCTDRLKRSDPPSQESRRRIVSERAQQRHGGAIPRAGGCSSCWSAAACTSCLQEKQRWPQYGVKDKDKDDPASGTGFEQLKGDSRRSGSSLFRLDQIKSTHS